MSRKEEIAFLDDLVSQAGAVNRMLASIDVELSEATNPADKEKIFQIVREKIGFDQINRMILEQMNDWIISTAKRAMSEYDDNSRPRLEAALGHLYTSQGRYDEAETLLINSLEFRIKTFGMSHISTIQSTNNLALLYAKREKFAEAESLYIPCLESCRECYGANNTESLKVLSNLSDIYQEQGRLLEAEENYKRCLEGLLLASNNQREADNGPSVKDETDPAAYTVMNKLANLYLQQDGRMDEAETLFLKCYEARKNKLGKDHPDTLTTGNFNKVLSHPLTRLILLCYNCVLLASMLGLLYERKGEYNRAYTYYELALRLRKVKLGKENPATLTSYGLITYFSHRTELMMKLI